MTKLLRWRWVLGCSLAWLASSALAQVVELAPSDALNCLTPNAAQRAQMDYPFNAWKSSQNGDLTVQAVFAAADRAPEVTVLAAEGDQAFIKVVKEAVQQWRVPCLPAGGVATLQQRIVFKSSMGETYALPPVDAAAVLRKEALKCMVHQSGKPAPRYPDSALRRHLEGFVLAKLSFAGPDVPPVAEVFARPKAEELSDEVVRWVRGLRMPCLSGERINTVVTYKFVIQGSNYGLQPLTLKLLLPVVKDIRSTTLQLDTTTMGCPFDVSWGYRRPAMDNLVRAMQPEVLPEREPLLAWLRKVELDLPGRSLDAVFGDGTVITIPCLKINLNPKEKS